MYNQVLFYNAFGNGDIFESREFVKEWMKLVPANSYHYSHGKNPRILLDIPELQYKEFTIHMDSMRGVWDDLNGNLYVNTWIGRNSKYILPGIGCTVEKLYEMHNDMLRVYNFGQLYGEPIDYIPEIDYSYFKVEEVFKFMEEHPEEKILIDNGLVQSGQAENFPFTDIINEIASNHPDKAFILSQPLSVREANVYYSGEIIQSEGLGFDLTEVSLISMFCNTIIGRSSGAYVYSQTKSNCMLPEKKLLGFTYHQQGSAFVVNTPVNIRKFWSPATTDEEVIRKIEEVIDA